METNVTLNPDSSTHAQLLDLLASESVIAVDIETNTTPPTEGPMAGWEAYGLSYSADVTDVALFAPSVGTIVFSDYSSHPTSQAFVKTALSRSGLTITAYNALFDLRSLGGHGGWRVHRDSLVWDSMVMNVRLLLNTKAPKEGLASVVKRYRIFQMPEVQGLLAGVEPSVFESWYSWMKAQRADLSGLGVTLLELSKDTPRDMGWLWLWTAGYIPPIAADHVRLAERMISEYVRWDTILAYYVWQFQSRFADKVAVTDLVQPFPDCRIPKWVQLPDLVHKWCRKARVGANQAIDGIKVGEGFLVEKVAFYESEMSRLEPLVFAEKDTYMPYPEFDRTFAQMMWYSNILEVVRTQTKEKGKASYNTPTLFRYWKPYTNLHIDVLLTAMDFPDDVGNAFEGTFGPQVEADLKRTWAEWLLSLTPEKLKRGDVLKGAPFHPVYEDHEYVVLNEDGNEVLVTDKRLVDEPVYPKIDLSQWVFEQCFSAVQPRSYARYLSDIKLKWLTYFWTYRDKKGDDLEVIRKDAFKPYYLHVICQMPSPDPDDLLVVEGLVTTRFWDGFDESTEDPLDYAIRTNTLSYGMDAMDYYLSRPVEGAALQMYRDYSNAVAKSVRTKEMYLHSQRDGRIHPIMTAATTTGRDSCGLPNLQNISMEEYKGMLVGDDGYELVEADFSNAENVMGGLISGDDAFIQATRAGDFHAEMRDAYWPALSVELKTKGDKKGLKELRNRSKTVTFSIPYGVGKRKLARSLRSTPSEAEAIMDSRAARFPMVTKKMKEVKENCQKRYDADFRPTYASLWDGARCAVFTFINKRSGKEQLALYKTWNYLPQGGVAILTHQAMVECAEFLEDNGYKSKVIHNVHDSLVFMIHKDEYFTDLPMMLIQIMCRQMPEKFLQRTIPYANFVAEFGPENYQKWGFRHDRAPLFPLDEFINKWGRHKLTNGETEAPTWQGDLREGWTLEGEITSVKANLSAVYAIEAQGGGDIVLTQVDVAHRWEDLVTLLAQYQESLKSQSELISRIFKQLTPKSLLYVDHNGVAQNAGTFGLVERLVALEAIEQRGTTVEELVDTRMMVTAVLVDAKKVEAHSQDTQEWGVTHGYTLGK